MFCLGTAPARGQFRLLNTNPVFSQGQPGNLFVEWSGPETLAQASLTLPPGWKLVDAALLRHGRREGVSWSSDANRPSVAITPADPVPGAVRLILQVSSPPFPSAGRWSLTPGTVVRPDDRVETASGLGLTDQIVSEPRRTDRSNLVAVFDGRTRVEISGRRLPLFTGDRSYTLELWFKSTGLGEVLLSSWDGNEETAYPIELVVTADGRMQYFRGEPGRHLSMASRRPVADGRWHHVAVVHDEVRGWSRLLIDSTPVDSLLGHTDEEVDARLRHLCLGGRCEAASAKSSRRITPYSGRVDGVRIWPTARTVRQIAASMGDDIPPVGGMISLDFDEPEAGEFVVTGDELRREPSDFLFYDPVEALSASMEEGDVVLAWASRGRNIVAFVVERSLDGLEFDEVGRKAPAARSYEYSFLDEDVPTGVIYYRVRQVLANGGSRSSGTLKVGLGEELPSGLSSVIVGNFPNPFSGRTTVRFEVSRPEHVVVSVWDLSGHQVALLADEQASPGVHEVAFDAGDLPSGTYFVRLQTDEGVTTRTLTLTR